MVKHTVFKLMAVKVMKLIAKSWRVSLKKMGYKQADEESNSDVILLNTCAIRENAEDRIWGNWAALRAFKKQNPDLLIGLCGCMAQEEEVVSKILKSYPYVDIVFGTHNIHKLPLLYKKRYV